MANFRRPVFRTILKRILEKRRFMQVLAGPRQVGKTTLARQAIEKCGLPSHYVSADEPTLQDRTWLLAQKGLTESLAGRFELIPITDWSYTHRGRIAHSGGIWTG